MTPDPTARPDRALLLAIDTATRTAVVALGDREGRLVGEKRWSSQHRHGSELLPHLDTLFGATGTALADVGAVVAGVGPGSFTGLRVGLATAKVVAYSRHIPVVAVSTLEAIAHGALYPSETPPHGDPSRVAVVLPAGTTDRYLALVGRGADELPALVEPPRLVPGTAFGGRSLSTWVGSVGGVAGLGVSLVAVDLEAAEIGIGDAAAAAGTAAVKQLGRSLLRIGAARLLVGVTTHLAELVPAYVALPRGIAEAVSGMAWSPDLR